MTTSNEIYNTRTSVGLFVLRLVVGGIFLAHGLPKILNFDASLSFFMGLGLDQSVLWIVAIIEILGGLAIILGVVTEIASLFLIAVMIGVVVTAKDLSLSASQLEILLAGALFALMSSGPGRYALQRPLRSTEQIPDNTRSV